MVSIAWEERRVPKAGMEQAKKSESWTAGMGHLKGRIKWHLSIEGEQRTGRRGGAEFKAKEAHKHAQE